MERKKILIASQGYLLNTSYGKIQRYMSDFFAEMGHEVYSQGRLQRGRPFRLGNVTLLPNGAAEFGEDIIPHYFKTFTPDIFITIGDPWNYSWMGRRKEPGPIWAPYIFVDRMNVTPELRGFIEGAHPPILPARFSWKLLSDAGIPCEYVPCAVDETNYKVADMRVKENARAMCGISQDAFVVTTVSNNQTRKNIDLIMMAFSEFYHSLGTEKENCKLLLHCPPISKDGWDLGALATVLGIEKAVIMNPGATKGLGDSHIGDGWMAAIYQSSDVYITLAAGEGFGLTNVESALCGVPNIMADNTSAPEFFREGETEYARLVPPITVRLDKNGGLRNTADYKKAAEMIRYIYDNPSDERKRILNRRPTLVDRYGYASVKKEWKRIIEGIFDEQ